MLDKRTGTRLANLWDDAKAAAMSEPERLLYRSNLLGSDKRITNYGGGNTSAKVMEKDPLDRRAGRSALGQGLGRRRRHDQARRLLHALHGQAAGAEGPLSRPRASKTRWSAICRIAPSTSIRAPPRSTRRCMPMCRKPIVDHMHPDAIIAIAASKNSRGADAGDLRRRDRLAALEAARLRARPVARKILRWRTRSAKGVMLESHGLFTWGDTPKECYETTIADHQQGHRLVRDARPTARPAFGGAAVQPLPAAERRAIAAQADAGHSRPDLADAAASSAISTTARPCWNSSLRRTCAPLAALGTSCPDHFLRTKIRPLVIDFDPANPDIDKPSSPVLPMHIAAYRADYAGLLRALQARRTARRCAIRMRSSI